MYKSFFSYFLRYIFRAKTRQRLLFLAMVGLFISSASLLVLQSGMGGFQDKLITRSKDILGDGVVRLKRKDNKSVLKLISELRINWPDIHFQAEYEIEALLRNGSYISPVLIHAFDIKNSELPNFLKGKDLRELISPFDLSRKVKMQLGDTVSLISPSHVDSFFGDIPRKVSVMLDDIIVTDVPEIDIFHIWVRLPLIQNLIRKRDINRIRIYGKFSKEKVQSFLNQNFGDKNASVLTWEDQHRTLVHALALENTVMLFLFVVMTCLVSLCITSGLHIFTSKIKVDLASFWILGASKIKLEKAFMYFLVAMSFITVCMGLAAAFSFIKVMDYFSFQIMPANFVDRTIPFKVTLEGVIISFCVPFGISFVFSLFNISQFRRSHSHVEEIRSLS